VTVPEYVCVVCRRRDEDPLPVKSCRHCGDPFCTGCLPDHETLCLARQQRRVQAAQQDRNGLSIARRFELIRGYFLARLAASGVTRELYNRPKLGDAREPTEEELVRRFAEYTHIPLQDIEDGIERAFAVAGERGGAVTSFRYCQPQILIVVSLRAEARVGQGPLAHGGRR